MSFQVFFFYKTKKLFKRNSYQIELKIQFSHPLENKTGYRVYIP